MVFLLILIQNYKILASLTCTSNHIITDVIFSVLQVSTSVIYTVSVHPTVQFSVASICKPHLRMFILALKSLSCFVLHFGQIHSRIARFFTSRF